MTYHRYTESLEFIGESETRVDVRLSRDLTFGTAKEFESRLIERLDAGVRLIRVHLSGINLIDSAGIGALARLSKKCQEVDGRMILIDPSPSVRSVLRIVRMDKIFEIHLTARAEPASPPAAPAEPAAPSGTIVPTGLPASEHLSPRESLIRRLHMMEVVLDRSPPGTEDQAEVLLRRDLNVGNSNLYREAFQLYRSLGVRSLRLDFSGIDFIDSAGISVLVETIKSFDRIGGAVILIDPSPRILKILQITKIHELVEIVTRQPRK